MTDRVLIIGPCMVDVDEYIEDLNDERSSNDQLPVSNEFLDEVYSQLMDLPDEHFGNGLTPEEVATLIHNVINKLTSTDEYN